MVLVTARAPNDTLYYGLKAVVVQGKEVTSKTMRKIGDCDAPAIITAAIYAGHLRRTSTPANWRRKSTGTTPLNTTGCF